MSDVAELRVRQGRPSDIRFITNSWLKSYRDAHTVKGCPNDLYYGYQHKIIETLLPSSGVLVLCDEQDDDHILGWLVYQSMPNSVIVIHYLYVKHPFRRRSLATHMVDLVLEAEKGDNGLPPTVFFTHKTKGANEILHHYRVKGREGGDAANALGRWIFDPYKLWLLLPEGWWK